MALQSFVLTIFVLSYSNLILAFPADLEIINGNNASIGDHPWMVSLWTNTSEFGCGGFLISPSWVATAGHCGARNISHIRGGSNKTYTGGILVEIDEVILHPELDLFYLYNDIALIRLKTPLIGDNIEPITLPDPDTELTDGDIVNIAGYGFIDYDNAILPDTLQELNVSIVDFYTCKERYKYYGFEFLITENVICAKADDIDAAPCNGDSGSAVVWNGQSVGIFSFKLYGCSNDPPSGFTKVSNYVNWIHNIIGV